MTTSEMSEILAGTMPREPISFEPPTQSDWQALEAYFGCVFDDDFRTFMRLMAEYQFPGDILNVSMSRPNGNDSIQGAYEFEREAGVSWRSDMIPFYAVGNGDCFCINKTECPASKVYYFYHDDLEYEPYALSFEDWVRQLPGFLA